MQEEIASWLHKIRNGDRAALAQAITLCENTLPHKQEQGFQLLDAAYALSGESIRVGITGTPGAGKSTFIEAYGLYLVSRGHKVAVLAVDPSSSISKGSILGDKTRMERLSVHPDAFIRPSPSGNKLGGVSARTAEAIILCEAAGYDYILVETVGVGQSETLVKDLSDIFVLVAQPGAGDELQGIKRGIMEMADLVLVNKNDGSLAQSARLTYSQLSNAVHLFPPAPHGIPKEVKKISSINHKGMEDVYTFIGKFYTDIKNSGWLQKARAASEEARFESYTREAVWKQLQQDPLFKERYRRLQQQVLNKQSYAYKAAEEVMKNLRLSGDQ
ncbi:MAG: methylmalonyl Co-A mutase-associated GTPase MeaB [Bacteroidia bacterium]|nr:methylmalonyl Co-A mutase-associated GTPase MeaB [Bacteroidia bacterium]